MDLNQFPIHDSPIWNALVDQSLKELPIFVSQQKYIFRGHQKNLHVQPGLEINISHEGKAAYVVGNNIYMQGSRHLILLPGQVPHQVFPNASTVYSRTVICLNDAEINHTMNNGLASMLDLKWLTELECLHVELNLKTYTIVMHILNRMKEEMRGRKPGWKQIVLAQLLELTAVLQRSGVTPPAKPREREAAARPDASNRIVELCCEYIAGHLHEELSLQRIAKLFSVSAEHLTRLFRREKGASFYRYVQMQRVFESKRLLQQYPDKSLTEIAYSVGFSSSNLYSRTFKSITNERPTDFRLRCESERP